MTPSPSRELAEKIEQLHPATMSDDQRNEFVSGVAALIDGAIKEAERDAVEHAVLTMSKQEAVHIARSAALEEAAKLIGNMFVGSAGPMMSQIIAEKIRALQEK